MSAHCTTALHVLYRPIRVAYPACSEDHLALCVRYAKAHWKKIGAAVLSGIFAGFLAGAATSRANFPLSQVVYAAPAASPASANLSAVPASGSGAATAAELLRLKAQNRELQALVDTLRKGPLETRTHRARPHKRWHRRAG
jgi:hypothetical protein